MVGMWSLVSEFHQGKTTWAFKARAVRVYEIPAYGIHGEYLQCIFHDSEWNTISCTLWEDLIDQLVDFLRTKPKCIILLLQLCRAKKIQGHVNVANMFNVTKMLLNSDSEECVEFKATFGSFVGDAFQDDLGSGRVPFVSIDDLIKMKEDGKHVIYGEILAIDSYKDWFYISCKGCIRKVVAEGDSFWCGVCNTAEVVMRYKVNVTVMDESANRVMPPLFFGTKSA
ncbi:unnamed protein product [Cuscuta europaea]|uniref:Replication factor A C-terminal domain-containing protein n=1 Tax=Cuscuta europaea TaxID=41803 RepID=A0A9P0Z7N0_CUSEU|nr:unnamed protein product [Cuscuta europaea]